MVNNQEPIRIAQIIGKWVGGGVESVVMNYYRYIDRSKIQFDFICDEDSTNIPYEEINSLGGKVILIPPYQKLFKYQSNLKKVLREGNYKIVHSHINALSVFPLRVAKKADVAIRIAHSHSTTNKKEWKKNILKNILRPFSKLYATDYFCCTEHAGRWLFGNKKFEKGDVYVLNNAINIEKFKFNEKVRNKKRVELGIDSDTVVIGHIGRFVEQKNHKFLIDLFSKFHNVNKNSKLVLIGQGPLEKEIREKVNLLNITDDVIFLGQINNVEELYQVFDIFIFPSLYEGLGMVLIEAQASGCSCVVSSEVPKIAQVTELVRFCDLDDSLDVWEKNITETLESNSKERVLYNEILEKSGYNIRAENKKIEEYYLKRLEEENI